MTHKACNIAAKNGLDADVIRDVYANGSEARNGNDKFAEQTVIEKDGVSLIGVERDENTFLVITMRVKKG